MSMYNTVGVRCGLGEPLAASKWLHLQIGWRKSPGVLLHALLMQKVRFVQLAWPVFLQLVHDDDAGRQVGRQEMRHLHCRQLQRSIFRNSFAHLHMFLSMGFVTLADTIPVACLARGGT